MSLASDYKTRAIAFKIANAEAQKDRVRQLIGALATEAERRVDGERIVNEEGKVIDEGGWGAAYLHLDLTSTNQETIEAVSSKYGQEYLREPDRGFSVEVLGNAIIIRWASQAEIDEAVEAAMNPPPVEPEPEQEPAKK